MDIKEYLLIKDESFTLEFRELYIIYSYGYSMFINLNTKESYENINCFTHDQALSEFFNLKLEFPKKFYSESNRLFIQYNNKIQYMETTSCMLDPINTHQLKWGINKLNQDNQVYEVLAKRIYYQQIAYGGLIMVPDNKVKMNTTNK